MRVYEGKTIYALNYIKILNKMIRVLRKIKSAFISRCVYKGKKLIPHNLYEMKGLLVHHQGFEPLSKD